MSTFHVIIEEVEEETADMLLCRVAGKSVWVPKAAVKVAVGELDAGVDIDFDLAVKYGLAPQILPEVVKCRSCGAPMRWLKTPAGKSIPIDAEAVEFGGNIVLRAGVAVTLKKGEATEAGEKRFKSHFATCVNSAAHRKK